MADSLLPADVEPLLRGRFGRPYVYAESCPSTQRLLPDDAPEGALAVADHQTAGRGRRGTEWVDAPGTSLLLSLVLRPTVPAALLPELTVVAARAVVEAVAGLGVDAAVKRPNDVLAGGRKLAGLLGEAAEGRVVLGIGVNVNQTAAELPAEARLPPTSLRLETGHPVERARLLADVLARLEAGYDAWVSSSGAPAG